MMKAIVVTMIMMALVIGSGGAEIVNVCPECGEYGYGYFISIQEAIDSTHPGDTILVGEGTYNEIIHSNYRTLIGSGAILTYTGQSTLWVNNSYISGFKIFPDLNAVGIVVYDNNTIFNNTILDTNYHAVDILGDYNNLTDNFMGNCAVGISEEPGAGENNIFIGNVWMPRMTPPPTTPPPAVEYKPNITVLANSIDMNLSNHLLQFLEDIGIGVVRTDATGFDNHRQDSLIIILGGPDAPEGVGIINQEIMTEEQQNKVRKDSDFMVFAYLDPWNQSIFQRVTVLAGSDRYETMKAQYEYTEGN